MTTNEGKSSKANLLETVTEFLASPDGLSRAEIREALECDGVDLQQLSNRYTAFLASAKKAQRKSILDSAREKMTPIANQLKMQVPKYALWSREQLLSRIENLCVTQGTPRQAFFRELKVNEMQDEEIREVLAQLEGGDSQVQMPDD